MRVDRLHPGQLVDQQLDVAVVIDVLRATSTAAVLLGRGAPAVRIVERPADLARLEPGGRYLVFSEVAESRGFGLECVDNSPAVAEETVLAGRVPVLVTTNGTRAVAAALPHASQVLLASFANLSSTARYLARAAERVTLLPAGDFASAAPHAEDERCADALEQILNGGSPDLPALLAACRDERVERRLARHPELARDLEVCFSVDRYHAVAGVVAPPAGGRFEAVRLAY